jgi:hypothetical protein
MKDQSGKIHVGKNVSNTSEVIGSNVYGGLIASFDDFYVYGSLYNDANSMITGTYAHQPDTLPSSFTLVPRVPLADFEVGVNGTYNTIYGRRASIVGGVMLDGSYRDAASVLTVKGLYEDSKNRPTEPAFNGLYNQGHIREIDIIIVGSDESGALYNAAGFRVPTATLPDGSSLAMYGVSTITDIGVINATNLINEGTISDIDVAINVSYALYNDTGAVLDGYSASHVEWSYRNGQPFIRQLIQEDTRANLSVGAATAANPFVAEGTGIINHGIITNFDIISSLGDVYNAGTISNAWTITTAGLTNTGSISDVTTITVGSNRDTGFFGTQADFINAGTLTNIEGITVTRDIFLESGSSLGGLGTLTARRNVVVNGIVNGGFKNLIADRKSTRLNSSHSTRSRIPSSA